MSRIAVCLFAVLCTVNAAHAGEDAFSKGPAIKAFGPVASMPTSFAVPDDFVFRHSFDVSKPAESGGSNTTFVAAARFINMHARTGVAGDNMQLAVVIHGKAVLDVTNAARYAQRSAGDNVNEALVEVLLAQGVQFIVCGQSATYYDVSIDDLLPGVQMALSAMTAHAVLQHQGYSLNPF